MAISDADQAEIESWVQRTLPLFEGVGISDGLKDSLRRAARRIAASDRSASRGDSQDR